MLYFLEKYHTSGILGVKWVELYKSTVCPVDFVDMSFLWQGCTPSTVHLVYVVHVVNVPVMLEKYRTSGMSFHCAWTLSLGFSFRCRAYVCGFFDYTFVGVIKEAGKDWNNRFITFVLFLSGLTLELSEALSSICKFNSSPLPSCQQTKEDLIKAVCICLAMPFHLWHAYVLFLSFAGCVAYGDVLGG